MVTPWTGLSGHQPDNHSRSQPPITLMCWSIGSSCLLHTERPPGGRINIENCIKQPYIFSLSLKSYTMAIKKKKVSLLLLLRYLFIHVQSPLTGVDPQPSQGLVKPYTSCLFITRLTNKRFTLTGNLESPASLMHSAKSRRRHKKSYTENTNSGPSCCEVAVLIRLTPCGNAMVSCIHYISNMI